MVKTCLSPNIWDNWNVWEDGSKQVNFKVPKNKKRANSEKNVGECSDKTDETEGTTGVGNGEAKLSMELKGSPDPLGGSNDPTDIADIDPKTGRDKVGFGYISVKEFSSGSKDLRLGVQATTKYLAFLAGFWFGVKSWLLVCYYQKKLQYKFLQHNPDFQNSLIEIRNNGDLEEIETIRKLLFDMDGKNKEEFILDTTITSGEICFSKIDRYKAFIFAVQKYVEKKKHLFEDARTYHNEELVSGKRSVLLPIDDPNSYYGLEPKDFQTPVPKYILHITFIQLLIAVEMFSSDIPNSISFLDIMAKNEALGGKELCDEIEKQTYASYKRDELKPVLIFVNESCGYFPVGSKTYDDIICERISQNKPKLGVKRDSRIRTECSDTSPKSKGKSPAGKSPAGKSPAGKSSGKSPAPKKQKLGASQSSS